MIASDGTDKTRRVPFNSRIQVFLLVLLFVTVMVIRAIVSGLDWWIGILAGVIFYGGVVAASFAWLYLSRWRRRDDETTP